MGTDRQPPVEELNEGAETPARRAASAIVLRDAEGGLEVLLVKRNPAARFMGGAWVFPGGAVQPGDEDPAAAARRELEEEAGLRLPREAELVPFSRWITPSEVEVRFDTFFFVARAPSEADGAPDGQECVDLRWLGPAAALEAFGRGDLSLVFPTIKHLEELAELPSVARALERARGREVEPVQPRVVVREGSPHVLLPGEPGYDDP